MRYVTIDHKKENSFKILFGLLSGDLLKHCCLNSHQLLEHTGSSDPGTLFSKARKKPLDTLKDAQDKQNIS